MSALDEQETRPCRACGEVVRPQHVDPCLGYIPGARFACCGHEDITDFTDEGHWQDGLSMGEAYVCAFPADFPEVKERFKALLRERLSGRFVARIEHHEHDGDNSALAMDCLYVEGVAGDSFDGVHLEPGEEWWTFPPKETTCA